MPENIFEYTDITSDQTIKTQVCVIGTGCGGATVAKKLADQGIDVVMLERGGYYPAGTMDQRELNMAGKISAERNFATSHDGGNLLMYGANVGGASVHYWADSYRTPTEKLKHWQDHYGIEGHTLEDLTPAFEELEHNLSIHEATDPYFNRMNQLMQSAGEHLGWHGHRVPQARKHCQKSGHCMQGCLYNAKQSQMVTHIPQALEKGARLYADAEAQKLNIAGGKVKSLSVAMIDRRTNRPSGIKMTVIADRFVVASGGFSSAFFLMKQGLKKRLPALGKFFSMNPSTMVHGLYDEDIVLWRNIPAAWSIDHYRIARFQQGSYAEGGYLLMPNQVQPALLAAMLPLWGVDHQQVMQQLSRVGGTISWIDDIENELGEIRMTDEGARQVYYEYGPLTQKVLKDSIEKQAELQFAAGAKKLIIAGHQGITLDSMHDLHKLDDLQISAGGLSLASPHPGGGCRMGRDDQQSVVDSRHKVHGFDNLFVSDSSVFPTSTSLDPSLSIMAFSHIAARHIGEGLTTSTEDLRLKIAGTH
ncbi:MAG: GMC family oxidoreductase [Pseudomonadales bacterium]|nr:GMC family oxidoreductase [Pseudomonadales bacterium]